MSFTDDFTASGAIKALMASGVRIPEDVRVISWSNLGNGPIFPFAISYVQLDPRQDGAKVAQMVKEVLLGDCRELCLVTKYVSNSALSP